MTFDPQYMASKMTSDYFDSTFHFRFFFCQFVTRNYWINEGSMNLMVMLGGLLNILLMKIAPQFTLDYRRRPKRREETK